MDKEPAIDVRLTARAVSPPTIAAAIWSGLRRASATRCANCLVLLLNASMNHCLSCFWTWFPSPSQGVCGAQARLGLGHRGRAQPQGCDERVVHCEQGDAAAAASAGGIGGSKKRPRPTSLQFTFALVLVASGGKQSQVHCG